MLSVTAFPKPSASAPEGSLWAGSRSEPLEIGVRHGIVFCVVTGVTLTIGWLGTLGFGLGRGLSAYQPAMTIQALAGLWFGGWGVLAGVLGGVAAHSLAGVSYAAVLAFTPGHFVHGLTCSLVFRWRGFDPRLPRMRDFWAFVLSAVVASNVLATVLDVTLLSLVSPEWRPTPWWLIVAGAELFGNGLPCLVLGTAMLKTLSPLLVDSNVFCRSWWRSAPRPRTLWRRLRDQPILVKLLVALGGSALVPVAAMVIDAIWIGQAHARLRAEIQQEDLAQSLAENLNTVLAQQWGRMGQAQALAVVAQRLRLSEGQRQLLARGERLIVRGLGDESHPTESLHFLQGLAGQTPMVQEAVVPLRSLTEILQREREPRQQWAILQPTGTVLAASEGFVMPAPGRVSISTTGRARYAEAPEGTIMLTPVQFGPLGWQLWLAGYESEALLEARSGRINFTAVIASLALLLALVLSGHVARQLEQPVARLTHTVRQAAATGFQVRATVDRADEIGELAAAFNRMSDELIQYMNELRRTTAEKERLAREMEIAAEMQQRILPRSTPPLGPFELAGLCRPAGQVAGDFYDYIPTPDGRTAVVLGDASGKGLAAGYFMTVVRTLLRAAVHQTADPEAVLRGVNGPIFQDSLLNEKFMTLFYMLISPDSPRLTFANAGHPAPIWYRAADRTCQELDGPGLPLGVDSRNPVQGRQADLAPGDIVVCYSDGITDILNPQGESFGTARLETLVSDCRDCCPEETCRRIVAAVDAFAAGGPQPDDQTLVVLRLR